MDRIVEKFGEKYYSDNSEAGELKSATAVYTLAYAIIML